MRSVQGLVISLFFLVSGCAGAISEHQQVAPLPRLDNNQIAVLPFINETEFAQGNILFYRIFLAELVKAGDFEVAQEGDIRNIYRQLHLYLDTSPDYEQMKILGDRLGVELIISGKIIEMLEKEGDDGNVNPSVAINLQLIDVKTGHMIWNTYHHRQGEHYRRIMHFGLESTMTGLVKRVSQEVLHLWINKGLGHYSN